MLTTPGAKPLINSFDDACRAVLHHCPDPYAKTYAAADAHGLCPDRRVQALYILNNISHWRGDLAKATRAFLKSYAKGL